MGVMRGPPGTSVHKCPSCHAQKWTPNPNYRRPDQPDAPATPPEVCKDANCADPAHGHEPEAAKAWDEGKHPRGDSGRFAFRWQSIAEGGKVRENALKFMSEADFENFVAHLAKNPTSGDMIEGTGGFRKLRYHTSQAGAGGRIRVIYLHMEDDWPVVLAAVYPKSTKDDLSPKEKAAMLAIAQKEKDKRREHAAVPRRPVVPRPT